MSQAAKQLDLKRERWSEETGIALRPGSHKRSNGKVTHAAIRDRLTGKKRS